MNDNALKKLVNWINYNLTLRQLTVIFITMGFFAIIPGAWMVGIPAIFVYSSLRVYLREHVQEHYNQFKIMLNHLQTLDFWKNLFSAIKERSFSPKKTFISLLMLPITILNWALNVSIKMAKLFFSQLSRLYLSSVDTVINKANHDLEQLNIGNTLNTINHYFRSDLWRLFRFVLTVFTLYGFGFGPSGILISYGINRYTTQEWLALFNHYLHRLGRFGHWLKNHVRPEHAFVLSVVLGTFGVLLSFHWTVGALAVETTIALFQTLGVLVGLTALSQDFARWLRNALENFKNALEMSIKHPGKIFGAFVLSHRLVHVIFNHQFVLGGIEMLLGRGTSYLGIRAIDRLFCTLISIFTNFFFGYNIMVDGSAYILSNGVTLPQIFTCMLLGAAIGYTVECLAHSIYDISVQDLRSTRDYGKEKTRSFLHTLYEHRWQIGLVTAFTPILMASPAASLIFLEIAQGNLALASIVASSTLAVAITSLYTVMIFCASLVRRRRNVAPPQQAPAPSTTSNVAPEQASQPSSTVQLLNNNQTLTPGFEQSRNQDAANEDTIQTPRNALAP